jgi:hypothetical protein
MSNDPVDEQLAGWRQALQLGQRLEPVEVAKQVLGAKFQMAVAMRLGVGGFRPVLKIVPVPGNTVEEYSGQMRAGLDKIGWQFVTIPTEDQSAQRRFAMAPITLLEATVTYHTTLASMLGTIQRDGLLPSSPATRQTDFPDTEGKIHVCEALTGDGSASRWVKIFCERYRKKPEEYGILRVDLTGLGARVYQDIRSQYGLIVDRIDRIPADRIRLERMGQDADLSFGPGASGQEQ